ncbi:EAL domain-containing protein [Marinomonas hwangdonensis]|uniref:EAL domain-containing protein n=1 Tax=Marinomonas hwangdonensis TaxID=1053647 RepID=A0A3M8Q7Q8_9GAMM|nr:GGDEF domain-containing response regulator [Marinomonas hwangdonensis]RNF51040.1 EAL domain-containing protein [Marinomonas hwangdonensis]
MLCSEAQKNTILKLLIVDDDDVDRERLRRMLLKSDIETDISEASSVEDSMMFLEDDEFDCVIVDYRLGLQSGLSLLNSIRTILDKRCAVIMVTGLGDEEVAAEAMRLGASDYLLKNQLQSSQLLRAIISSIQRAELEKKLHNMAHYDNLTGLASRPLLHEKLQHVITSQESAAVAFLDLDNFKPINDHYGHGAGDYVLFTIANRLNDALRKNDTLARIGGDEFVLLLRDMTEEQECDRFLERLIAVINAPIELVDFDCHVKVSVSIGIAMVTSDSIDADTILRRADQTMYRAKHKGNNNILFFDPEEEVRQLARKALLQAAEKGIQQGEFELYYQPQMSLQEDKVVGVEALLRWNHPILGHILPTLFLEALEHPSVGLVIGEWVIEEAIQQAKLWRHTVGISVNVSSAQFFAPDFITKLALCLEKNNDFLPALLTIEISENILLKNLQQAIKVAESCRRLGVSIAIDNFGADYASLVCIQDVPINKLKVDKKLIQHLPTSHKDKLLSSHLTTLSKALKIQLIAEAVETNEQRLALLKAGYLFGQGYHFVQPMNADKVTVWIQSRSP